MSTALELVRSRKAALEAAIPRTLQGTMHYEGIVQGVALAFEANPRLNDCPPRSVYAAVIQIVRWGLDVSGQTGQAYLVPLRQRDGTYQCHAWLGGHGRYELAMRSGRISRIITGIVHLNDDYDLDLANGLLRHGLRPTLERGEAIFAYCRIWLVNSEHPQMEIMTLTQFSRFEEDARKKAGGRTPPSYAGDNRLEMWRWRVLAKALKWAPKSIDYSGALAQEAELYRAAERGDLVEMPDDLGATEAVSVEATADEAFPTEKAEQT